MTADSRVFEIERVGAQGDGVALVDGDSVFIPFTLQGERVTAVVDGGRGRLVDVVTPSADRILPVCRHFGVCGGCALQHMEGRAYRDWKTEQVRAAFAARGLDAEVGELIVPEGGRRRVVLTARRDPDGLHLGFHAAQSHALVDIIECPVMAPPMLAFLRRGHALLERLVSRRGEARVTLTMSVAGLDVMIAGIEKSLSPQLRAAIAEDAAVAGVARVSIDGEPVFEALAPFLVFGDVDVPLPPGVFIQAMAEAEVQMARLVVEGVGKAKRVADLFAGIGAFTFPLAKRARVLAVDSNREAIAALSLAVRQAKGVKPITPLVRDLFREPLSPLELNAYDAVVFDPPRAGAEAQVRALARSKVATVVAVSCHPATLARDARLLVDGGYKMGAVTPIDQFRYSPHVEAVSMFRR